MKARDFKKALRDAGCTMERHCKSSHQVWKTPSGAHIVLSYKRGGEDVSPPIVAKTIKLLHQEGIEL